MKVSWKKRIKNFTPFRRALRTDGATKRTKDDVPPVYIVASVGDDEDARDEPTEIPGSFGDRDDDLVDDIISVQEQQEEEVGGVSLERSQGAIIGQEADSKNGSLLDNLIPDLIKDEEDGMLAMFQALHANLPEAPEQVKALQAATLAQILKVWRQVEGTSAARMALTDEDASMVAMFREVAGSVGGGLTRGGQAACGFMGKSSDFMDSLLARILYAVRQGQQGLGKIVAPTPERCMESEDVSLKAMFREIAQLFPGTSEAEVENHMLTRMGQVAEKVSRKKRGKN